jgi:hypothetical protein
MTNSVGWLTSVSVSMAAAAAVPANAKPSNATKIRKRVLVIPLDPCRHNIRPVPAESPHRWL